MTPNGEALEWALALQQAPGRRTMVRVQPLPSDITELLSIAGGSAASLEAAARRVGTSEPKVLDAARFFVQQAMLFEGADAYRVLGVPRTARPELIRDHHRLLLRWLHPDRSSSGSQWDSAFSGRVNWAWNQLRTDALRAAYDASLGTPPGVVPPFGRSSALRALQAGHLPAHLSRAETSPSNRVAPLAVLLVGLVCVALAWLALRREGELDRLRDDDMRPATATEAPPGVDPWQRAAAPPDLEPVRRAAATLALQAPDAADAQPAPRAPGPDAVAIGAPGAPGAAAETAGFPPGSSPGTGIGISAAEAGGAGAPDAQQPRLTTALPAAAPMARTALGWSQTRAQDVVAVARAAPRRLKGQTDVEPAPAPRLQSQPAPQADETDPLRLMQQAQARVRGVTRYLVADAPSPAWASADVRGTADDIRDDLRSRLAGEAARELELMSPHWRLDTTRAAMQGRYAVAGSSGTIEQGELAIELARRDGQWQVASLRLAPAP